MEPVRILQVGMTSNYGGLESFIMNVYRNIDRNKIQFDFLSLHDTKIAYQDEILEMGGRVYPVLYRRSEFLKRYMNLPYSFFKKHPEIRGVHLHRTNLLDIDILIVAKHCKIPLRIIHSHSTGYMFPVKKPIKLVEKWNRKNISRIATHFMACSREAGKWMFHENTFKLIPNAIDVDKFKYNHSTRLRVRKEFGISNQQVIGHIGYFTDVKNHDFIIDVFNLYHKKNSNSILLLIGDGPLKNKVVQKVSELGLLDSVIFTGISQNVHELLQMLDVFLFPSKFEGFGISVVEAQAAGLPCLVSERVTREVSLTNQVKYLPISDPAIWVEELNANFLNYDREKSFEKIKFEGFDIKTMSKEMEVFYMDVLKGNNSNH